MTRERVKADFSCEIVESTYAAAGFDKEWELPPAATGTIVRWDGVQGFPAAL